MIWWVIFLFVAGMALVLAEFIVPGGICGTIGAVMLVVSSVLGCYNYPDYSAVVIIGEIIGAVVAVALGMYILSRSRAGKAIILGDSQLAEKGWVASESDLSLLGAQGKAFTKLRPAGTVVINGKRIGAVSEGAFIEQGAAVRVIEVQGNRVVVEEARNS